MSSEMTGESNSDAIRIIRNVDDAWMETVEALDPTNPFHTRQYIESQKKNNLKAFLLVYYQKGAPAAASAAFLTEGRFKNSLQIMTTPAVPDDPDLWEDFHTFIQDNGIGQLQLKTFASLKCPNFPDFNGKTTIINRKEYVLRLEGEDLWKGVAKNHRRNIKKASRHDIVIATTTNPDACENHVNMITATMTRRHKRGENVDTYFDKRWYQSLLKYGCGEIYQATMNNQIISSVLILRAAKGAYYHSAGTSSDGMATGVSHSLVYEIATRLQKEGVSLFNLGGTEEDNPGLVRFKAGFGADQIPLEHRTYLIGNPIQRIAWSFLK